MFLNTQTAMNVNAHLAPAECAEDENPCDKTQTSQPALTVEKVEPKEWIDGHDRRATGLMPMMANAESSISIDASGCKLLLRSIEESRHSGYIHISAEQRKSRAAVLVFRGRALGCVYGNKQIGKQLFAEDAYSKAFSDLADPENTFSTCLLSEELVVAAASLFHGAILHRQTGFGLSPQDHFNGFHGIMARSGMPGCIVLSGDDEIPVGMVYLFGGKIVGFYLHAEGWQTGNWREVLSFIGKQSEIKLRACMLPITCIDEVERFTFSLLGLEREVEALLTCRLVSTYNIKKVDLMAKPVVEADRFIPVSRRPGLDKFKLATVNHAYDIDP